MANIIEEVFTSEDFVEDANDKKEKEILTENADIVEERIQPTKVFQRFAGKIFDASQSSNTQEVFDIPSKEDAKFENPLQKYRRLQFETTELTKQLDEISKKTRTDSVDPTKDIVHNLNGELSKLWYSVEELKSNPQLSSLFTEGNNSIIDTVDPNYLFKKLQHLPSQTSDKSSHAAFTLYHDGDVNTKSFHIKELEDRVQTLEKIIGPSPEHPSVGDVMSSIDYLNERLELISDEMKLESLVRRSQSLRKELQSLQSKSTQQIEEQITKTKEEKINKMFDMMQRWDQVSLQLPTIVSRLRSLKTLNEESADVIEKVHSLDTQQKLIQQTLESNQQILNQVSQSLAENSKLMSNQVQSFESRITQLQEKVKKMGL